MIRRLLQIEAIKNMSRKAFFIFITAPVALLIVALSIANRQAVTLSFNPFNANDLSSTIQIPLFLALSLAFCAGMLFGSVSTWFKNF